MSKVSNTDSIIKRIRDFQKKTECSLLSLATCSGLHRNTLRNLHKKEWNPTSDTLDKVIKYLDAVGR